MGALCIIAPMVLVSLTRSLWVIRAVPTAALMTHVQWVPQHNEAEELARIHTARMKVAAMVASETRRGDPMMS